MIDNPRGPRARGLGIQAIVDKAPTISLHGNASRYMCTCDYTQETVRISFVRCLEADRQAGGGRQSLPDLDTSFLFPCDFEPWPYFHRLPPNQKHTDDDLECVSQAEELLTKKNTRDWEVGNPKCAVTQAAKDLRSCAYSGLYRV
jgi:hypothetical protein